MTVFTSKTTDTISIMARAESDGIIGDMNVVLESGMTFLGHPYSWWADLEDGEHEVE